MVLTIGLLTKSCRLNEGAGPYVFIIAYRVSCFVIYAPVLSENIILVIKPLNPWNLLLSLPPISNLTCFVGG